MKLFMLAVVSVVWGGIYASEGQAASEGSSASATSRIVLILPPSTAWRQAEIGSSRELCLRNMPAKHISVSTLMWKSTRRAKRVLALDAQGCLSELQLNGVSELIITAE
ncbi:hypothetical protein MO867_15270 [Microbulbifer sp. OS29]|uniref:Uncharacterized protein n=1 Tax=Microbulbifer okhotskensis TaxID=2926617 RepID=A0A9X2EPY5_9GAMM|nr:hypothetical protein [Microbulbifer okhotskensis]MCO1335696.1 hypothetical protein [Microbulbifer okhotskensis]